jgi:Rps23 Pro-64 3,4-dihydroxylase Tpa1-like proline 4-hydroxylase
MIRFALADHDAAALARAFARAGRVRIPGFLAPECAVALADHLAAREDWLQVVHSEGKVFELDRKTRAGFAPERRAALDAAVFAQARYGFQYRYESIRVPDEAAARAVSSDPLAALAAWLSSGPVRDFLRKVTGRPAIAFADAQGTAYAPGDFLTGHDDAVTGKERQAAYVLGLTRGWRLEWGGLLLFHAAEGAEQAALVPGFNTLDLFSVPQPHSVSLVSPAAARRRYAVTGWLRAGAQPD